MSDISTHFKEKILDILQQKLARKLTEKEVTTFSQNRPLLGYEAILEHISSPDLSPENLEEYVGNLVKQNYS